MWNVQLLNLLPERNGTGNCIVELIRRLSKSVAVCGSHYCRHTRKARHRRGTDHPSKLVPRKSKLNRCIAGFINLCQFFCKCPCVFDSLATSLAHVGLHRVSCVANEGRVAVTPNEGWASVIDVSTFNLFHWRRLNTVHYHRVPSIVEIETNCLTIGTFVFHPWFLCFHCVPLAHSTTNVGGHKVLPIPKEDLIAYCFDVCRLISSNTRIACVAREARLVPLLSKHGLTDIRPDAVSSNQDIPLYSGTIRQDCFNSSIRQVCVCNDLLAPRHSALLQAFIQKVQKFIATEHYC
mmetsp:Transcript_12946/g.47338  ORF Transcript_12946/g.47338 Transcript_12946/m.47338 type:complete len:293 (-) Transcript_12946:604-1482(-)